MDARLILRNGLLDQNPGLNRAVARTGDLTLDLGGRIVRLRAGD